jgi:hypothetical protein
MNKVYNIKRFLLPDSQRSMSCYHAKILEDKLLKFTIHDCQKSIQLKNDLNNPEEIEEAIEKLTNLADGISDLIMYIKENFKQPVAEEKHKGRKIDFFIYT